MADEFATPISKLQQVSTRDAPKPGAADMPSYEDVLRQATMSSSEQQYAPMTNAQPPPQAVDSGMYGGPPPSMDMVPQAGYAPANYSYEQDQDMYAERQPAGARGSKGDAAEEAPPASKAAVAKPTGWRGLLQRHKTDLVMAVVIFAIIVFVLPRVRAMPRFQQGLPMYVVGLISLASACIGNSLVLAIS